eukprot:GHVH01004363.1.p1 GENE.GHVH01004363.1~~GHVH01004363.1.p1  ORF type:complete len:155 (-),score=10.57 GHVH01004363.1:125-589(-)
MFTRYIASLLISAATAEETCETIGRGEFKPLPSNYDDINCKKNREGYSLVVTDNLTVSNKQYVLPTVRNKDLHNEKECLRAIAADYGGELPDNVFAVIDQIVDEKSYGCTAQEFTVNLAASLACGTTDVSWLQEPHTICTTASLATQDDCEDPS